MREQLNVPGGHLTSSEQVDSYTQKPNFVENTKIDQLYLEVCYMQEIHPWLCLKQVILLIQDYRNLHLIMCATYMKTIPSIVTLKTSVALKDFNGALTYMHGLFFNKS